MDGAIHQFYNSTKCIQSYTQNYSKQTNTLLTLILKSTTAMHHFHLVTPVPIHLQNLQNMKIYKSTSFSYPK